MNEVLQQNQDELSSWLLLLPTGANSSESPGESHESYGRTARRLEM